MSTLLLSLDSDDELKMVESTRSGDLPKSQQSTKTTRATQHVKSPSVDKGEKSVEETCEVGKGPEPAKKPNATRKKRKARPTLTKKTKTKVSKQKDATVVKNIVELKPIKHEVVEPTPDLKVLRIKVEPGTDTHQQDGLGGTGRVLRKRVATEVPKVPLKRRRKTQLKPKLVPEVEDEGPKEDRLVERSESIDSAFSGEVKPVQPILIKTEPDAINDKDCEEIEDVNLNENDCSTVALRKEDKDESSDGDSGVSSVDNLDSLHKIISQINHPDPPISLLEKTMWRHEMSEKSWNHFHDAVVNTREEGVVLRELVSYFAHLNQVTQEKLIKEKDEVLRLNKEIHAMKERFAIEWRDADREKLIKVAQESSMNQMTFYNKNYDEVCENLKQSYQESTKKLENERQQLSKHNENLTLRLGSLEGTIRAYKTEIEELQQQLKAAEEREKNCKCNNDKKNEISMPSMVLVRNDDSDGDEEDDFEEVKTEDEALAIEAALSPVSNEVINNVVEVNDQIQNTSTPDITPVTYGVQTQDHIEEEETTEFNANEGDNCIFTDMNVEIASQLSDTKEVISVQNVEKPANVLSLHDDLALSESEEEEEDDSREPMSNTVGLVAEKSPDKSKEILTVEQQETLLSKANEIFMKDNVSEISGLSTEGVKSRITKGFLTIQPVQPTGDKMCEKMKLELLVNKRSKEAISLTPSSKRSEDSESKISPLSVEKVDKIPPNKNLVAENTKHRHPVRSRWRTSGHQVTKSPGSRRDSLKPSIFHVFRGTNVLSSESMQSDLSEENGEVISESLQSDASDSQTYDSPMSPNPDDSNGLSEFYGENEWDSMNDPVAASANKRTILLAKDLLKELVSKAMDPDFLNNEDMGQFLTLIQNYPEKALVCAFFQLFWDFERQYLNSMLTVVTFIMRSVPNFPHLLFEYFTIQGIPKRLIAPSQRLEFKIMGFIGSFLGMLCESYNILKGKGLQEVLFKTMLYNYSYGISLMHGVMRSSRSAQERFGSTLEFDNYDIKEKAVLFCSIKPPPRVFQKMRYTHSYKEVQLLFQAAKRTVPEMTYSEFLNHVIAHVKEQQFNSALEEGTDVLTMLYSLGDCNELPAHFMEELKNTTVEWRRTHLPDGIYAAFINLIGKLCEHKYYFFASCILKLKTFMTRLVESENVKANGFICKAVESSLESIEEAEKQILNCHTKQKQSHNRKKFQNPNARRGRISRMKRNKRRMDLRRTLKQ